MFVVGEIVRKKIIIPIGQIPYNTKKGALPVLIRFKKKFPKSKFKIVNINKFR